MCKVANRSGLKVQGKFIMRGLVAMFFLLVSISSLGPKHTPVILNIY
jgi:hypothetical protein